MVEELKIYNKLQWLLMNYGDGIISVGLLKIGKKSNEQSAEKILLKQWSGDVFLTNPSPDTPLNEGD